MVRFLGSWDVWEPRNGFAKMTYDTYEIRYLILIVIDERNPKNAGESYWREIQIAVRIRDRPRWRTADTDRPQLSPSLTPTHGSTELAKKSVS